MVPRPPPRGDAREEHPEPPPLAGPRLGLRAALHVGAAVHLRPTPRPRSWRKNCDGSRVLGESRRGREPSKRGSERIRVEGKSGECTAPADQNRTEWNEDTRKERIGEYSSLWSLTRVNYRLRGYLKDTTTSQTLAPASFLHSLSYFRSTDASSQLDCSYPCRPEETLQNSLVHPSNTSRSQSRPCLTPLLTPHHRPSVPVPVVPACHLRGAAYHQQLIHTTFPKIFFVHGNNKFRERCCYFVNCC